MDFKNKLFQSVRINKKKYILIAVVLLFTFYFIFSDYGLIKRFSLELELKSKNKEVEACKTTKDSLNKIIYKLQTDSLEIERIAREKYGMTKDNEEVYYIETK